MKEDQDQKSFSLSRFSQQSQKNEDKSLFEVISTSLAASQVKHNRLIFMSKALSLMQPIAYMIMEMVHNDRFILNELVLLIDFQNQEIQYLNEYLSNLVLTKPLKKSFDEEARRLMKVKRLNTTIDKRKACYVRSGVYAVSNQIFLTDLLRGQAVIHPKHITKIIVKLNQKVKNYFNYYGWLTTMLRIKQQNENNKWKVPILFLCNQPQHYSFQDDLKQVYRVLFCGKVVIWPFGRAQIHKRLSKYRQNKKIKQWEHSLSHSQNEKNIQQYLKNIYGFLKKAYATKYGEDSQYLNELMFGRIDQQSFQATRGEFKEFSNIKVLLNLVQNGNKMSILNKIGLYIEQSECELWKSNNNQIVELIQTLTKCIKESIFVYQRTEAKIKVDLKQLICNQKRTLAISAYQLSQFVCQIEIDVKLGIKIEQNQKIAELIKVIEDAKMHKKTEQNKVHIKRIQQQEFEQYEELQYKIQQKLGIKPEQDVRNIMVMCNSPQIRTYVYNALKNYLRDHSYLNYLISLQFWLKTESHVRISQLKRIFQKKKNKLGQLSNRESKVSQNQKIAEYKLILEQILLCQIQKLQTFLLQYELQLTLLNEQKKNAQSQGSIFKLNEEESRLQQNFNQNLLKSNFQIVDITKIRLTNYFQKNLQDIQFQSGNGKININIIPFSRNSQICNFYGLMNTLSPQSVIFYSPNTHLLRSLYLLQIQSRQPNLQSIHVFSYQDSYQTKSIHQEVIKQDKAFWQISQKRSQLSDYNQTPFLRVKSLNMRDGIDQAVKSLNGKTLLRNQQAQAGFNLSSVEFIQYKRIVIVDSRQFKSSLPAYLYHYGFQIVPMFLKNGDYILSDEIAVEKKSVNTRDFQTSLKNGRLDQQLKRMNGQFKLSYLLIEFQQEKDCRKQNFSGFQFSKGEWESSQSRQIRKKILQLITKYEKVRLIWSTSVKQTCQYFKILKMDHTQPDLFKFSRAEVEEEVEIRPNTLENIVQASASKQAQNGS